MIGWLGTSVGRLIQAIVGIALLWSGIAQVTVFGLTVMLIGLVAMVVAATPPRQPIRARAGSRSPQPATK